eukprot:TRINITY_DN1300_c0_g1_i1.p1 TRINITY_DN1300_c0_g1~~TRINITY_DN1300_c0_g1_i1.p1  ORF type:complete len:145 (-),score=28.47 TRINITY_DN1300_c0_g1_i1:251-685(-)
MVDVSDPAISEAVRDVLSDATDTNWLVLGYEGNTIKVQSSGSGGLSEMVAVFRDDQSQYGYLRVNTGDAESKRTKFALISWCGEQVGALKRAKMSVHKASIKTVITNYAVEIHGTTVDDLSEDAIMSKIKKAQGADYSGNTSTL